MPHELVLRHPPLKAPPEFTSEPIDVYHPGYDNDVVPLMSFPGYDSKEGDLWHDFAHTACAIISNNRFDGWLSISQDPEAPHVSGELIAPGKYWWHVPQGRYEFIPPCDLFLMITQTLHNHMPSSQIFAAGSSLCLFPKSGHPRHRKGTRWKVHVRCLGKVTHRTMLTLFQALRLSGSARVG